MTHDVEECGLEFLARPVRLRVRVRRREALVEYTVDGCTVAEEQLVKEGAQETPDALLHFGAGPPEEVGDEYGSRAS